jgi:sialic acid synthase SpsE
MSSRFLDSYPNLPLVIAEIGAKYAEMPILEEMVRKAHAAGADMVKFQTFTAETITTPGSFFTFEDGSKVSQLDWFKNFELSRLDHEQLDRLCKGLKLPWISTPSHPNDLELLEHFDPPAYKTGSDDLTNIPFLRQIASMGRPMIVSTGMCTLEEIEQACNTIVKAGCDDLILLHCVVSYPAKAEDANLRVIETLRTKLGFPVGLSDHTVDEFTSVLATQMGACVVEKHFTLDHALKLPDHQASLDPQAFSRLVERVRLVKTSMGSGEKIILPTEEKWRAAARKSLFAALDIPAGKTIEMNDIAIRRPAIGIPPISYDQVIGMKSRTSISQGTAIAWEMLCP